MASRTNTRSKMRTAFWRGAMATLPLQVATLPFGMMFGVFAVEAGFDMAQILGIAIIVVAGASSFVALELVIEQAPPLLIIAAAGLVNLRMAMYSAAMVPHWRGVGPWPRLAAGYLLNDQTFAVSIRAYEEDRLASLPEKLSYFFGSGFCCVPFWTLSVLIGVFLGTQVPEAWGIDVATSVLFLALAAPMVRTPAHMVAMAVAMGVACLATGLPPGVGVVIASFAGILAGMAAEALRTGGRIAA